MKSKQSVAIKISVTEDNDHALCLALAKKTSLPLISETDLDFRFFLTYNHSRLELHENVGPVVARNPFFVDFLSGSSYFRFKTDRRITQPLAKAVGIKPGVRPKVCDLTAGFGSDGFVLASLGCRVTLVERSPVIWALLKDGLIHGEENTQTGQIIRENLTLFHDDSYNFLANTKEIYDTIYLDPMYPSRKNNALSKLKMRFLRSIVGADMDSCELLELARQHALKRVVVKRPSIAKNISPDSPSFTVKSKKHRYDIYLTPYL